jgi:predicted enzyme related to lactoylglutathione lyase
MDLLLRWLLLAAVLTFARAAAGAPALPPVNDSNTALALTGKFIWFDLVTDEIDVTRQFYADLFGWNIEQSGPAPERYSVVTNAGRRIGGILQRPAPPGAAAGARWISLMSIPNVIHATQYAQGRGGKVLIAPADLPHRGAHAILRDPQGAVFGVLRSSTGDAPDIPLQSGMFIWADLLTRDPDAAAQFYRGLAGYGVQRTLTGNAESILLVSGEFTRAGISHLPPSVDRPGWLPFVQVDDVLGTIGRAVIAGGKVVLSPRPELLDGQVAVIADPRGGIVGVVNASPRKPGQ